ncbi:amino acid ABC transporter permease [Hyphomicrobium sp.]|uniref:amino acid ABC transporter permease n=1 Tax=Hyphomicrobium sp. TaxID=82 RepID=UPI002E2F4CD0|nr:amino acid ABC transporter permease [Hyphomicrobium sp.]HEX2840350.1 amino acid ABC transporter permease [Hyphomicrobium sp.]
MNVSRILSAWRWGGPQESGGRDLPPALRTIRDALFASPGQAILSLVLLWLLAKVAFAFADWALFGAVFHGQDGTACRAPGVGACWPFITHKMGVFLYGRYPEGEIWRVNLTYVLALAGLVPLMTPRVPRKLALSLYMLLVFPVLAFILLRGGPLGLPVVGTDLWGGLMLTLVIASVGIAASFPLGILLALARRSELPIVRWVAVGYIELVRGVPLVTVLFMASVMLPLFLPPDVTIDKLLRALVGVALFSAAYLAEVIRGGLQAIPRGQYEAADALGLGYWRKMGLVVLPQAIRLVIPGLVNSFISLFKDTSLVLIIGLFDLLGIVEQSVQADAKWVSPQTAATGYFFAGIIFWIFCFAMSRYSAALESKLQNRARS